MTTFDVEMSGMNVVLLGSFNPSIFQPEWFAAHDLIPNEEARAAKIDVIHRNLAQFNIDWVTVHCTQERFQVSSTTAPSYDLLSDLVIGTFRILSHTPLHTVGINTDIHYRISSTEEWHDIGHKLVPPEHWQDVLVEPGMRSLTVEGVRPDDYPGAIRVKVEPSLRVHPGLYLNINDHIGPVEADPGEPGARITSIVAEVWSAARERSTATTDVIKDLL